MRTLPAPYLTGRVTPAISPRPSLGLFLICKTGGRLTGAVRIVRDSGWEMVYSGLGPRLSGIVYCRAV